MTNTYKRVSAALLSVLLLCMFTFGASAAATLNVGVKSVSYTHLTLPTKLEV